MYGKVCDWVKGGFTKAISYVSLAVTVVSVTAVDVFAQEAASIAVSAPNIDWTTTTQTLLTAFTGVVLAAAGVGLSMWVLQKVVSLFKTAAK